MEFQKIRRTSVAEEIVEYLKSQILSRQLKPGTQLPSEERLAENIGVGRGTIREALRVLRYLGLIERRDNGTYVAPATVTASDDWNLADRIQKARGHVEMLEVRRVIEPPLASFAAERADDDDIAEIERYYELMVGAQEDIAEFIEHDNKFHLAVFAAARNHLFQEILRSVQQVMKSSQGLVLRERRQIMPRSLEYHRRILQAIKDRDPNEAQRQMRDHIEDIDTELTSILKST